VALTAAGNHTVGTPSHAIREVGVESPMIGRPRS